MAEGKNFSPSKEREENPEFRQRDLQKRAERSVLSIVPKKTGEKGRWENSSRRERRQAEFGDKTWTPRHEQRNERRDDDRRDFQQGDRKSFHSDRRGSSQNGRGNFQNSSRGNSQNGKRNDSPVQFTSRRRPGR